VEVTNTLVRSLYQALLSMKREFDEFTLNYVDAATAMSESYGGGGDAGTGWGKDKDEDEQERARRCAKMANWLCKPIVRRWKRGK